MPVREHHFVGTNPNPVAVFEAGQGPDDDATPPMPANGRVTKFGADGAEQASSGSPRSEAEIAAIAARVGAPKAPSRRQPTPEELHPPYFVDMSDPGKGIRLRCLELSARSGKTDPTEIIADAKALFQFVENG